MSLEAVTLEWMQNLGKTAGPLYALAAASRAGQLSAYWASISALIDAQVAAEAAPFAAGAGAGAVAAGAIPVVAAVGVWVALGSGYYEARQMVKNENAISGFSQGFVCGLLRWNYDQTLERFRRENIRINVFDEATNEIRVSAYMDGLQKGFAAGIAMPRETAKDYLKKLRQLANVALPRADDWAGVRNVQIGFVISLAAAGRKHGLIKAE